MEKLGVMSFGNGCESKEFFNLLKVDAKSPFDGGVCNFGNEGFECMLNGDFFKAISNRDIIKSNPSCSERDEKILNYQSTCFPIVKCGKFDFMFPHVTYSSFIRCIDSRVENFKKNFANPNQVFAITNGQCERFWLKPQVMEFVEKYQDFFHDRLIIVSAYLPPMTNYFELTDFPCIQLGEHSIIFDDKVPKFIKEKTFKEVFEKFCCKNPNIAKKISFQM